MSVVFQFAKNSRETVCASVTTFNGKRLADLSVYVDNQDGELVPTRKGVAVRVEDVGLLLEAVRALVEASA